MKMIYTIKQGKYTSSYALAAETIEDAIELAKALGMEPEDEVSEWVKPIPLVEVHHDA